MGPTQKDAMISHWEMKLDSIHLDTDTPCTKFINNFEMFVWKLTNISEAWGDVKMVWEFKSRVDDPDYDTEVRTHKWKFTNIIKKVRKIEQDLHLQAAHKCNNNKRNCCFKAVDKDNEDTEYGSEKGKGKNKIPQGKQDSYIPFILL